jgi:hypothetical protein
VLGVVFFLLLFFFDEACGEDTLLNLPEEPVREICRGVFFLFWGLVDQEFYPGCQESGAHLD